MIKFIIVDDNKYSRGEIDNIITEFMFSTNYKFCVKAYDGITNDLFNESDGACKCIYLLDYYLVNLTAVDVAREIRKRDWDSPIIIFTSEDNSMALSTFKERLQILDFVVKNDEFIKNLHELFQICIKQFNYKEKFFVKSSYMTYYFEYDKILYVYKCNNERKICVVTDYGSYYLSMTLTNFCKLLNDKFVYTHKSCIVNSSRIKEYDWKSYKFILDTNEEVYMLSRLRRKELMEIANC